MHTNTNLLYIFMFENATSRQWVLKNATKKNITVCATFSNEFDQTIPSINEEDKKKVEIVI